MTPSASVGAGFCFVHAADLHLGGRRWLRTPPEDEGFAERVRLADRLALEALVELCLREQAALLLCAGDIIDGWCRDHSIGLALVNALLKLRDASCEVALVLGNHDARTRVIRPLLLPGYTRVLGLSGPETRIVEHLGLALHGWSFPALDAPIDVAALFPPPRSGFLNIGLLHTSAEGRCGHAQYAPCSRRTLRSHGYDYWALGHVHAREVVSEAPWVVFPGNLQARGARETGPKGASLVRVREGRIIAVEHRVLDALRFETVVANVGEARHFDDVLLSAHAALGDVTTADGRPRVARLILAGIGGAACALSMPAAKRASALRAMARELCTESIWLDETWIDAGEGGAWLVA